MKYYRGFKRSELNFAETNISKLLSRMLNEKKKKKSQCYPERDKYFVTSVNVESIRIMRANSMNHLLYSSFGEQT